MKKFLSIILTISMLFTINTFSVFAEDILIEYKKERLISIGFPERFFETNNSYMINDLYSQYHNKVVECSSSEVIFYAENPKLDNPTTRTISSEDLRFVISTFTSRDEYPGADIPPYQITEVIVFIEYCWAERKPFCQWTDCITVNWDSNIFTLKSDSFYGYDEKKWRTGDWFTAHTYTTYEYASQNGLGYIVQLPYMGNGMDIIQHQGLSYFILLPATPHIYTVPDELLPHAYTTSIVANYVHDMNLLLAGEITFSTEYGDVTINCSGLCDKVGTNTNYYYSYEPLS